jgi:putative NADH-flavin reductase
MNVLIFGASGRVGSHITSHALQDGQHVTVLVRSPEKLQQVNPKLLRCYRPMQQRDLWHAAKSWASRSGRTLGLCLRNTMRQKRLLV